MDTGDGDDPMYDLEMMIAFDVIMASGRPRGLWALDRRKVAYSLVDRINPCSTIYDFEQLDSLHNMMANKHVSVVGGGFLGKLCQPF